MASPLQYKKVYDIVSKQCALLVIAVANGLQLWMLVLEDVVLFQHVGLPGMLCLLLCRFLYAGVMLKRSAVHAVPRIVQW